MELFESFARHALGDRGEIQPVQDYGVPQRTGFDPFAEQHVETDEPWGVSRGAQPPAASDSVGEMANPGSRSAPGAATAIPRVEEPAPGPPARTDDPTPARSYDPTDPRPPRAAAVVEADPEVGHPAADKSRHRLEDSSRSAGKRSAAAADGPVQLRADAGPTRADRPVSSAGSPAAGGPAPSRAAAIASYLDRHSPSGAGVRSPIVSRPERQGAGRSLRDEAGRPPPPVKIHIGQIRVDGQAAAPAPRAWFARPRPMLGLGDFIERRQGR